MSYTPPRHILLRRRSEFITDKDLAFLEQALQRQLHDCAFFYGLPAPGVTLVTPDTHLPEGEALNIDFVDDDGEEAATAHHGWAPGARHAWALVGVKESLQWQLCASHEALEAFCNLQLEVYAPAPDGARWPLEVCDPVEALSYPMFIELFGESREVPLSNYVLPSFWLAAGRWPFDYLGMLESPFTLAPGGYAVVERDGRRTGQGGGARHGSSARPRATSRAARLLGT